jgi:cobaltochelatase CobN
MTDRQPAARRQRVTRTDGKTINVVQKRGHLSYCFHGCCCGIVKRGYAAVPVDVYKDEWVRRKLRNRVHLTKSGCLGPCALANVAQLLFDGHSVWFHSVNDSWQVRAIYDYVEMMLEANRFLPPPPELLEYNFNYYTWDGGGPGEPGARLPRETLFESHALSGFAFLTHADTDLLSLANAIESFPDGFGKVHGVSLSSIHNDAQMRQLLDGEVGRAEILLVKVLGRLSNVPGYGMLLDHVRNAGQHLLLVSGTGEPDPELAASSTVPPRVLEETLAYLQAGGWRNLRELFCFASDALRLTGFGFEPPAPLPEHGIYHPDLPEQATIEDWLRLAPSERPTAGIVFYRAHALAGNTGFIDALVGALDDAGLNALPIFTSTLKAGQNGEPAAFSFLRGPGGASRADILISTLSFAMGQVNAGGVTDAGWSVSALERLGIPVLQAVTSGASRGPWETSARGLNPLDTAMNVALPEFDGRIVTVPVSFKEHGFKEGGQEGARFVPDLERCARVAGLALRIARLRRLPNSRKRIAFIFTNSASKASQIGNAVGLDAPASLLRILEAMQSHAYEIGPLPESSDALIHELIDRCSYDATLLTPAQLVRAAGRVSAAQYQTWFEQLSPPLRRKMVKQWGEPPGQAYLQDGYLALAGLELGNAFVALQPPRGYGMDPDAIYHTPDLPPPHHYYALYRWLREPVENGGWGADAIVHVGKHGTLEWLPGKGVGLSADCYPDAFLADMPLFYPFILSDPGEGAQAKRRGHAVVIDHLPPPLTRADTYGPLAELAALVDEYYQLELLDPAKLPLLQGQIWDLVQRTNLGTDLKVLKRDHGDHVHEWDDEFTPEGVPVSLAEMRGDEVAHFLEDIDGYLCEIGAAQIRDGLHTFGQAPLGGQMPEMLRALTRLPNLDVPGLHAGVSGLLGLDLNVLLDSPGQRFTATSTALNNLAGRPIITHADALELVDEFALHLCQLLQREGFNAVCIPAVLFETFGQLESHGHVPATLQFICRQLKPNLDATTFEIQNLLRGLAGEYVPAGPSGAPSRGMAHVLPTGRNFYAVDPRALPSQAAWRVGEALAREVLDRYRRETGKFPESVSISIWGTSAMRTQGDDVAEILALLGVRPTWHPQSRRVDGVKLISLEELARPRIDVTVRISGFFRDAFPHLIALIDDAVQLAMQADEPPDSNYPRKHFLSDLDTRLADLPQEEAEARAAYRVFGSAPGAYGAGILPLIQEQNWRDGEDFARAFVNWGGYAYTNAESGVDAREDFRERLSRTEVAVHNQDNREHDIFDSDDYLQFFGGMIASIRSLSGAQPRSYFGDTQNPERARVRDLKEEALRVYRSRVVNPKWIEGMRRHGYKGGLELTATVDYLFGFDATAQIAEDFMYEGIAQAYALDPETQQFLRDSNPWALNAIAERLLEADTRGMWNAEPATREHLEQLRLESEAWLEMRGETARSPSTTVSQS